MVKIKSLKSKAGFLLAVAGAAVVGGATTAIVSAAIPSSTDGKIHACYRTGGNPNAPSGDLRVIDNEANQNCAAQETALSWPATASANGSQEAYAFITRDPSVGDSNDPLFYKLDPMRTKNVTSMVYVPLQFNEGEVSRLAGLCVTLPFTPKNIQATPMSQDNEGAHQTLVGLKDEAGVWSLPSGNNKYDPAVICQNAPTANAIVETSGGLEHFLKFEN